MLVAVSAIVTLAQTLANTAAATALASPVPRAVLAQIQLPKGIVALDEVNAGGAVWSLAIDPERGYLYRIDPATNAITAEIDLSRGAPTGDGFYPSGLVAGFGSLWVTDTYRNVVLRLDPVTGRVLDRIQTGRYPAFIAAGGGSIWVTQDQAGSVARIDPGTNAVVATIPVGRQGGGTDQPFDLAWDPYGARILVTLPASRRVAAIDGASQQVRYLAVSPAFDCGRPVPVRGGFWLDDTTCSNDLFRWDDATGAITAHIGLADPYNSSYGAVATGGALYTDETICGRNGCHGAVIVKRNATTGGVLATRATHSARADLPSVAAGDLWVGVFGSGELIRVGIF